MMTKAQEELVQDNISLVYKISSGFHVPLQDKEDLIQEAFFALCLAAKRFDPTRGDKFVTYAYSYISGRCKYFVSRNSLIKPARSKESGYKQFVTYETRSLDDYVYMPDPRISMEISQMDEVIDIIRNSRGSEVAEIVELCGLGFSYKEIGKKLNIKQSKVISVLNSLRTEECINNLLRSDFEYGTGTSNNVEKERTSSKDRNDGITEKTIR